MRRTALSTRKRSAAPDNGAAAWVDASAEQADRGSGSVRLGIYWHLDVFEEAKRAYLADLDTQPDAPDSFARWIARAIGHHAVLPVDKRTAAAADLSRQDKAGRGATRSFTIAADIVQVMETAIVTDRRSGGAVLSRSEFVAHAVRIAISDARIRYGGSLPPAPSRLPNKPPR